MIPGHRQLTKNDLWTIRESIQRLPHVNEIMFNDVRQNILDKYSEQIIGVETDSNIKAILMKREIMERERLARVHIQLTSSMKEAKSFPSTRKEALPKFYPEKEIPQILKDWTEKIQNEINQIFMFSSDQESVNQIREYVVDAMKNPEKLQPYDLSSDDVEALVYRFVDLKFSGTEDIDAFISEANRKRSNTMREEKIDDENREELTKREASIAGASLKNQPRKEKKKFDIGYLISTAIEFKKDERPLTRNELQDILSVISFRKYYKGGELYSGDPENSRMLPAIDKAATKMVIEDISSQLRSMKFSPALIPRYKEIFKLRFEHALSLDGKWVGNIMAASIGESSTQSTLNTFHAAGNRAARSQITGFAKLKSILDATMSDTIKSSSTIFTQDRRTAEQMRLRISDFQYTIFEDLVHSHRLIPCTPTKSMSRWETVHDAVFGQGHGLHHTGYKERFNLHRENPIFADDGLILEIQLNVQELFARRISIGKVADSIQQYTSNFARVTTSSTDIGLLNIYVNHHNAKTAKIEIPSYISQNQTEYILTNVIYPELLSLKICGIDGLNFMYVNQYKIFLAIDYNLTELETESENKVLKIKFSAKEVIGWGLSPQVIRDFVLLSLRGFAKANHVFDYQHDEDENLVTVNTAGLTLYDENSKKNKNVNMDNTQEVLNVKSGKVKIRTLLKLDQEDNPIVKYDVASGNLLVSIEESFLNSYIENGDIMHYGIDLDTIGNMLGDTYSKNSSIRAESGVEGVKLDTYLLDRTNSTITIIAFELDMEGKPDKVSLMSNEEKFLYDVDTALVDSSRLEQSKIRWYYVGEGRSLENILSHKDVDSLYTRTDNTVDVYRVLGVESCRTTLLREIAEVISSGINPVHSELLADSLTFKTPDNKPLPQTFHGMGKKGVEFLAKSWEQSTSVFMESAFGAVDKLRSFPAQIMFGKLTSQSRLSEEDMKQITQDPDVFGRDFPVQNVGSIDASMRALLDDGEKKGTLDIEIVTSKPVEGQLADRKKKRRGRTGPVSATGPLGSSLTPYPVSPFVSGILTSETPQYQDSRWIEYRIISTSGIPLRFSNKTGNILEPKNILSPLLFEDDYSSKLSLAKGGLDEFFETPNKKKFYQTARELLYPKPSDSKIPPEQLKLREIIEKYNLNPIQNKSVGSGDSFFTLFPTQNAWPKYLSGLGVRGINIVRPGVKVENLKGVETKGSEPIYNVGDLTGIKEWSRKLLIDGKPLLIDLYLASGIIDPEEMKKNTTHEEEYQELYNARLILSEFILGVFMGVDNSNLCIKIFDNFSYFMASIIYISTRLYESVNIVKPPSSTPVNSERFLICRKRKNLKDEEINPIIQVLVNIYGNIQSDKNSLIHLLDPEFMSEDTLFARSYSTQVKEMANSQTRALNATVEKAHELLNDSK